MISCFVFIFITILSALLTCLIRHYSISHAILDIPNKRSSHNVPTPRGGGLAIAGITLGGLIIAWFLWPVWPWLRLLSYLGGTLLISFISWLDDLHPLSPVIRFGVHSLAAFIVIRSFGFWQIINLPLFGNLDLGWFGIPISFLWIVGLTNSYNFMDGIDGIAGTQALVAGIGWALLGKAVGSPLVQVLGVFLAATSTGFLLLNWPPARIFMGDIGSAFLGFSFASLAIIGSKIEPSLAIAGALLVWPFLFDTSFTFFRRLKNKENVFSAHRSHLYQRLVLSGYSHRTVTLLYLGLNILGLILALLVLNKKIWLDLMVLTIIPVACYSLWWFTVIREKKGIKISYQAYSNS